MKPGPILVVGSPRSGTSIFRGALARATDLPCFGEGQLLDMFELLEQVVDHHYQQHRNAAADKRHLLANARPGQVKRALARALLQLADTIHGGTDWIDKTHGPEMLRILPHLATLNRPVTIFFIHRRAIENVVSRLLKFPNRDLADHAKQWLATMQLWRTTRDRLKPGTWLEIEHKQITDDPDGTANKVGNQLDLTPAQRALLATTYRKANPQKLASETLGRVLPLEETGWSTADQTMFRSIVGEEMHLWGYTEDHAYIHRP